jgi:hypothetical protein
VTPEPFLSVTIGASPAEVWHALRDPAEITRWFGWEYDGLEDEIALIFHGAVPEGIELPPGLDTAIEVDDDARTFRTGPHLIEVIDADGGAVLRMTRVVDVGDDGWEMFHSEIDHIEEGWMTFFQQLAFAITHHRGEDRRTAFGMGLLPGDPLAVLGLGSIPAPGQRYEAAPGPGDPLTGTVWFRSARQVGLTVEGWNDGLLVAAAVPGGTEGATPAMAIATTYGLDDAAVAALGARWSAWWQATAVTPPEEPEG